MDGSTEEATMREDKHSEGYHLPIVGWAKVTATIAAGIVAFVTAWNILGFGHPVWSSEIEVLYADIGNLAEATHEERARVNVAFAAIPPPIHTQNRV